MYQRMWIAPFLEKKGYVGDKKIFGSIQAELIPLPIWASILPKKIGLRGVMCSTVRRYKRTNINEWLLLETA